MKFRRKQRGFWTLQRALALLAVFIVASLACLNITLPLAADLDLLRFDIRKLTSSGGSISPSSTAGELRQGEDSLEAVSASEVGEGQDADISTARDGVATTTTTAEPDDKGEQQRDLQRRRHQLEGDSKQQQQQGRGQQDENPQPSESAEARQAQQQEGRMHRRYGGGQDAGQQAALQQQVALAGSESGLVGAAAHDAEDGAEQLRAKLSQAAREVHKANQDRQGAGDGASGQVWQKSNHAQQGGKEANDGSASQSQQAGAVGQVGTVEGSSASEAGQGGMTEGGTGEQTGKGAARQDSSTAGSRQGAAGVTAGQDSTIEAAIVGPRSDRLADEEEASTAEQQQQQELPVEQRSVSHQAQQAEQGAQRAQEFAEQAQQAAPGSLDQYHVVMSTSLALYTEWQSRIMYYWYRKVKASAPHKAMGGFTRLLSGRELDGLEKEMPTVLVDPLPPDLEQLAKGFVVLNRPYAFQQWVHKHMYSIPERYVLMTEPDHLFLTAPPLWAGPTTPAAYPFEYMRPKDYPHLVAKFNYKNVSLDHINPTGNSPVMIHRDQLAAIVDRWLEISFRIKQDQEADKAWGWVQEMYAYCIAAAQAPDGPVVHELHPEFMLQPPWESSLKSKMNGREAYIIHYTYSLDFDKEGAFTRYQGPPSFYHWDKRDFTKRYPPKDFPMPPEGCTNEPAIELLRRISEAAQSFPDWDSHTRLKRAAAGQAS
ncbi:hypothetical protein N2152v2_010196 [Parachlorella kessleri]